MAATLQQILSTLLLLAFAASGYQWFRLLLRRRRTARERTAALPPVETAAPETESTEPERSLTAGSATAGSQRGLPPSTSATERAEVDRRPPLVPLEPRERPFWGPSDFLIWFGVMLVASVLFRAALDPAPIAAPAAAPLAGPETADAPEAADAPETADAPAEAPAGEAAEEAPAGEPTVRELLAALVAQSLATITATLVALAVLRMKSRRAFSQLGLMPRRGDLRLGLAASLLILPPAMLLMALVNLVVPYEHPVLDLLTASPSPIIFIGLFVTTVLITPVVEEFSLRVLLQGGLQSIADARSIDPSAAPDRQWRPRANWPIVATSLLFALLHAGQGLAPVPLFVLAVALGYLYRQTGRLFPPLVVHVVLNAITMIVTFTDLLAT